MALIKCPECGKEISDKAKQCIHCGFPLTPENLSAYNKPICPFSFLNNIDRSLYQRYITVEINICSSSNSFYDSLMDLTEEFIKKVIKTKKLVEDSDHRQLVGSLKMEKIRNYFIYTAGINKTTYENVITLGISINAHKHSAEHSFKYDEAIKDLCLIHSFLSNYYNKELKISIPKFDFAFYDNLSKENQPQIVRSKEAVSSYPIKEFEDDCVTLRFENCKLWVKNKILVKYVGDQKDLDLANTSIEEIAQSVFNNNSSLESIVLPRTLYKYLRNQFNNCSRLKKVTFTQENIDWIHDCFSNCPSLNTIEYLRGTCNYFEGSFNKCAFERLYFQFHDRITIDEKIYKEYKRRRPVYNLFKFINSFNECQNLLAISILQTLDDKTNGKYEPWRSTGYGDSYAGFSHSFNNCRCLREVNITSKWQMHTYGSFNNAKKLKNFNVPSNVYFAISSGFENTIFSGNYNKITKR